MDEEHSLVFELKVDGRSLRRHRVNGPSLGILLYCAGIAGDAACAELKRATEIVYDMKARYDAEGEPVNA